MSVLIKGMDMPIDGAIGVVIYSDGRVTSQFGVPAIGRAVPVPEHGDLIDRDKFRKTMFIGEQCLYSWDEIEDAIDFAPTVIPADQPKEETR